MMSEWKKAAKGSWKVVVRSQADENEGDSDSDEQTTPRGARSDDGPAPAVVSPPAPLPDEKAREDEIRLEVEKQVQARLKAEEERLKNTLKAQYEKSAPPKSSGAAFAEIEAKDIILVSPVGKGYLLNLLSYQKPNKLTPKPTNTKNRQFGEVWKGTLHGKEVAVKKLFLGDELEENILKDFRREVEVMMYVTVEFLF